jgi:tetratricopeptide (TPR) repeat protein
MRTKRGVALRDVLVAAAFGLLLTTLACGPSEDEKRAEARSQQWAELQQSYQQLTDQRQELSGARARIAELEEAGDEAAEDATAALEGLRQQTASLQEQISTKAEEVMGQIVNFINDSEILQGEEMPTEVKEAIRMKSREDIEIAMEYVEEGGDYSQAENILKRSLAADPENTELQEKLAWARDWRYVTEERFDQIENGWTQAQVREALGPVNLNNIRDFDGNRIGWFYPKDPELHGAGTAAGVYFQQQGGRWVVYRADWNAVKAQQE